MTETHEFDQSAAAARGASPREIARLLAEDPNEPADDETYQSRENICNSCEYFDESQNNCRMCACNLTVKMRLKLMECPIGKW